MLTDTAVGQRTARAGSPPRAARIAAAWRSIVDALTTAPAPSPDARSVPAGRRLAIVAGVAAWAFALSLVYMSRRGFYGDFYYPWLAAQHVLAGRSPYLELPGGGVYPTSSAFAYPLPTALFAIPFSFLPLPVAGALFFALSSALLAFAVTRDGYWRLPIFLSAPFISAATQAQWSPLIVAAGLLPALGFLAVLKPNIGLAIAAYRPTRRVVIGGSLVLLASLAVAPHWPIEWLRNSTSSGVEALHRPPVLETGGVLLLLALLRWRAPEARLLLVMACVPQLLFWNDQLPLMLVARTRREVLLLTVLGSVGYMAWELLLAPGENYGLAAARYIMVFLYLPALVLVLLRKAAAAPAALPQSAG